jgi:hypothetical protein
MASPRIPLFAEVYDLVLRVSIRTKDVRCGSIAAELFNLCAELCPLLSQALSKMRLDIRDHLAEGFGVVTAIKVGI